MISTGDFTRIELAAVLGLACRGGCPHSRIAKKGGRNAS